MAENLVALVTIKGIANVRQTLRVRGAKWRPKPPGYARGPSLHGLTFMYVKAFMGMSSGVLNLGYRMGTHTRYYAPHVRAVAVAVRVKETVRRQCRHCGERLKVHNVSHVLTRAGGWRSILRCIEQDSTVHPQVLICQEILLQGLMELNILHKFADVGIGLTKRGMEGCRQLRRVCISSVPETSGLVLEP